MDKFLNTEDLLIGRLDSLWLRDILLSGKIDDVETNWFANLVQRKWGRGNKNNFWNDSWIQDCSLKYLYPQLYHLSNDKHIKVENAGNWESNKWEWKMNWSKILTANECAFSSLNAAGLVWFCTR
jgi:hypothetical protein